MQRYVMCLDCTKTWQEVEKEDTDIDGVTTKYVLGKARKPMRCDGLCNCQLDVGQECCALTATTRPGSYKPWESECLTDMHEAGT